MRRHAADSSIDALSYAGRALGSFHPQTIVLISPHAPLAADTFVVDVSDRLTGSLAQFGDPQEHSWPGDPELALRIIDCLDADDISCASREGDARLRPGWADHATIVPLVMLAVSPEVRLVVLSLSFLSAQHHRRLGEVVAHCAEDLGRRVAFVASGDLSHRLTPDAPAGYSPHAATLDAEIVEAVAHGALGGLGELDPGLVEAGGECGLRSIITLGGFCGEDPVPTRVLSYEGPWGVGYLSALAGEDALARIPAVADPTAEAGRKGGMPGGAESEIVALARNAISGLFTSEGMAPPVLAAPGYPPRAGVFVSLHRGGQLRGCIGTIAATMPTLAEEVAHNAVQAATRDPRFRGLGSDELFDLEIKVDVLHKPEGCELSDLDPGRYGVIVSSEGRRGLLLPDLDGVDDVSSQIDIAMRKAGIPAGSPCRLERFLVDRYV